MTPVVLATRVGAAKGSQAAAAALACAASEPDRAALLVDLEEGRAPRPTLVATAGARRLEERLAAHLPDAAIASRGRMCHLQLPSDADGIQRIVAVLPLVRESAGIVHLPPQLLRPVLEKSTVRSTAALLRADLAHDRALTALAARDLVSAGLRVAVLRYPLGWIAARTALLGAHPVTAAPLPRRLCERLLDAGGSKCHPQHAARDRAESG